MPSSEKTSNAGITLTELVVASTLALVVVIGIGSIDVVRLGIEKELHNRFGISSSDRLSPDLLAMDFERRFINADRFNLLTGSLEGGGLGLQLRTPVMTQTGCKDVDPPPLSCYDDPFNYQWDEYVFRSDTQPMRLDFYHDTRDPETGTKRDGVVPEALTSSVTAINLAYVDTAPPPPSGWEPFDGMQDNNVLRYEARFTDAAGQSRVIRGLVTTRAAPYANVNAGADAALDSGTGLTADNVSPPPPSYDPRGGGGSVICTELYHQGYIPQAWFLADHAYARTHLDGATIAVYHAWARPVVAAMRRSVVITQLVRPFATAWAQHMAFVMGASGQDSALGRFLNDVGVPLHRLLGHVLSRKQASKEFLRFCGRFASSR